MKTFKRCRFWKVKFLNWLWFIFILKGNEFSNKLSITPYTKKYHNLNDAMQKLVADRRLAHKIDIILNS